MRTLIFFVSLALAALAITQVAQTKAPEEDIRVNLTRVLIEKARAVGVSNPNVESDDDGYQAVRSMVADTHLWRETDKAYAARIHQIKDLAQGFTNLERSLPGMSSEIRYEVKMGEKGTSAEGSVVIRFLYPTIVPRPPDKPKGYEWQLLWAEAEKSSADLAEKKYLLQAVSVRPL